MLMAGCTSDSVRSPRIDSDVGLPKSSNTWRTSSRRMWHNREARQRACATRAARLVCFTRCCQRRRLWKDAAGRVRCMRVNGVPSAKPSGGAVSAVTNVSNSPSSSLLVGAVPGPPGAPTLRANSFIANCRPHERRLTDKRARAGAAPRRDAKR